MPTYNIVQIAEPGAPVLCDSFGAPYRFNDGREAAAEAKRLGKELGLKLSAKIKNDPRWRSRELSRFNNGEYLHLPWAHLDWWYDAQSINQDIDSLHFAHVSQKRGAMIAYTASEEDGSKDKQTLIKPSKYLERFCEKALKRYRLDPRTVAAKFAAQFAPVQLKFAETAADIQRVYEQGPESCMSHPTSHYITRNMDIHPVTTYAAGDLQVAYLETKPEDEDGNEGGDVSIIARALVWPKMKTHSRIYGDHHRMHAALTAAGYVFGAPVGAKLTRIPLRGLSGRFIAPYIDAGSSSGGGSLVVYDENTHFVIGRKDTAREYYACSLVEGCTTSAQQGIQCTQCDEYADPNNFYQVRISCDDDDTRAVCGDCAGNGECFWQDSLEGQFYDHETCEPVEMDDQQLWTTRQFEQRGAVCALTGLNCDKHHMVRMHNGVLWSHESFRRNGFTCGGNGKHYPRTERVTTVGGSHVSKEFVRASYFQCEDCKKFDKTESRTEIDNRCFCRYCAPVRQSIMATTMSVSTATSGSYATIMSVTSV